MLANLVSVSNEEASWQKPRLQTAACPCWDILSGLAVKSPCVQEGLASFCKGNKAGAAAPCSHTCAVDGLQEAPCPDGLIQRPLYGLHVVVCSADGQVDGDMLCASHIIGHRRRLSQQPPPPAGDWSLQQSILARMQIKHMKGQLSAGEGPLTCGH